MITTYKILIADRWIETGEKENVVNPYNGRVTAKVCLGGRKEIDAAILAALKAFEAARRMTSHEVSGLLKRAVHGIIKNRKRFVDAIVAEAGKPVTLAGQEVDRTIMTFSMAADEAGRMGGELLPVDADPRAAGRYAITKRFPIGVVAGISPFNFPLNLVAHKVAPAIASKNTIILKPATATPGAAVILGEILLDAGMTPGQYNVVPCHPEVGQLLVTDDRVAKLTFTGSPPVGWKLKALSGRKRVTLELGGNAAAVVCGDADLKWAIPRIAAGAYGYAGQVCISVQRILIHRGVYDKAVRALLREIRTNVKAGDPRRRDVVTGPMINTAALRKTEELVREAVAGGAKVLTGGARRGRVYEPTLLSNVKKTMRVVCEEAFAPIAVVAPFGTVKEAIDLVNDSAFGLQMGIFTRDIKNAFYAFEESAVGGVIINDFPTFRVDNMPYGGVKLSGFGREGVRYAIEEMTEMKVMVIRP